VRSRRAKYLIQCFIVHGCFRIVVLVQ